MSKIQQSNNLRQEDFPDQSGWIGRLFVILNAFMTSCANVLDNNIDYTTNIKSVTKDFDFSSITFPLVYSWPFTQTPPLSLIVCSAMKNSSPIALIPAWSFNASTQEISVASLSEVSNSGIIGPTTVGPRYKFTIRATV